jgi:hypothetical protein
MMSDVAEKTASPDDAAAGGTDPFSSNGVRLSAREWAIALAIAMCACLVVPWAQQRREPFSPSVDYRIPYESSEDYYLYAKYARYAWARREVAVIGDSVVWGHYVGSGGTLSHFLNEENGATFAANLGLDGTRPVALAGLIRYYARDVADHGVILHLNPLWMSSPAADMSPPEGHSGVADHGAIRVRRLLSPHAEEESAPTPNHPGLLPQVFARPYGYSPPFSEVVGVSLQRHLAYASWLRHMRMAYYENFAIQTWSLNNPYRNPLSAVRPKSVQPDDLPQGAPVPWFEGGVEQQDFPWVPLEKSYQWRFFKRAVQTLRERGNRVFVVVGPLNTHLMRPPSAETYGHLRAQMENWLKAQGIPYYAPEALASEVYADTSHPLEQGYAELAHELFASRTFGNWLKEVRGSDRGEPASSR